MRIARLTPPHAEAYRAIMLQAYADESAAFTATVSERAPLPLAWWTARVADRPDADEKVFGAFEDARIVGVAGLRHARRRRTRHKALLFGMCVLPPFRRQGLGRSLVEAVLDEARSTPETRVVQLTVVETNAAARRLYAACGFVPFGTEPFALRMDDRFVALVHMWREVGPG